MAITKYSGCFALSLLTIALNQAAYAAEESQVLDEVVVSGTREAQRKSEAPATVDVIKGDDIRKAKASHPSEIMGRVPGVWVNITGGEGHQTAIRQPLTTSPVYAYLEDGIPVRATGFFNHNALYEVNMPQSGGIEVTKGPGSALYGSDAIGGVVNILSRRPPASSEVEASGEAGSFGWKRVLLSGGNTFGNNGVRADLNLTKTDGWRQATGYTRNSGNLRWDRAVGNDATLKVFATLSNIDQQTAGSSTISLADYINNPTVSYTPISLRKVKAARLSAAYEKETANSLLSITPFVRDDSMDLLANWSLGYDPTIYNTYNKSLGLMAKYRTDFEPYRTRLIMGVDIDNSPGGRTENSILTTKVGSVYTAYALRNRLYDYKVTYQGVSPYVHGEMSPTSQLRLTGGLRYDDIGYDFRNNLPAAAVQATGSLAKWYGQSASIKKHYTHFSPKLGATYAFTEQLNGFLAYNHSFRAPSEGQLFRPAATTTALLAQQTAAGNLALQPIKVDSYETGLRGKSNAGTTYEVSLYRMNKRDDVLTQRDPLNGNAPVQTNGGKTLHQGIEVGVGGEIASALRLDVSCSYAKHTYDSWVTSTANYTGKEMAMAPRVIANTRLTFSPGLLQGGGVGIELVSLGSYWMDDANTTKYSGHDLLNLSGSYHFSKGTELFAKVNNLTDKRFAESTSGINTYAPGLPRAVYVGVQGAWK